MTDLTREAASAFVAAAGLELDEVSGTKVVGHIDLSTDHHTPWGRGAWRRLHDGGRIGREHRREYRGRRPW